VSEFIQVVLSGLAAGSIYSLAAVGFTLLWQASQTINFAQGEFVMLPAFFILAGMTLLGLPMSLAIVFGLALSLLILGLAFKKLIVEPLLPHGTLPLVIASIATALLMKEGVKEFYGPAAQPFPPIFPQTVFRIAGVSFSLQDVCNLAISMLAIGGLQLFLDRSRTGRCIQATAQNPAVAEILGVNVNRMVLYAFLINAGFAVIASLLITPIYLAKFSNGETLGVIAFIAAIVGGFNQIRGALAGGLLIGIVDNLAAVYVSLQYRAAIPLILLIVIILVRPQGLLGTSEGRAV
jgi:branched-chain amino acid transport system permease protein